MSDKRLKIVFKVDILYIACEKETIKFGALHLRQF